MNDEGVNVTIENNEAAQRWEAHVDQQRAIVAYQYSGETIIFTHTEVPPQLEGQGIASRLVQAALDDIRDRHHTVIPLCPFVAEYIRRHPDYKPLVRRDFLHLVGGGTPS
jgi:uncharacterized protein